MFCRKRLEFHKKNYFFFFLPNREFADIGIWQPPEEVAHVEEQMDGGWAGWGHHRGGGGGLGPETRTREMGTKALK